MPLPTGNKAARFSTGQRSVYQERDDSGDSGALARFLQRMPSYPWRGVEEFKVNIHFNQPAYYSGLMNQNYRSQ
jgi:hypothetical protein